MKTMLILAALVASTSLVFAANDPPKANKEMRAVLHQLSKLGGKPIEQLTPEEARLQPTPTDAVKMLLKQRGESSAPEPVASTDMSTTSFKENANAKPLNKAMMEWFAKHEFKKPQDKSDPRVELIAANLRGLPSTTIISAEIDPLRSGGKMLADKLKDAGVSVDYKNYDGVTHEFFGMSAVLKEAKKATQFAAKNLRKAFGRDIARSNAVEPIAP